jgi:c-di-GMP-binding flagellar brake protein YcgR
MVPERRKHYRFLIGGTAVLVVKPSDDEIDATLKDLSLGGAAVYASEKIGVGQKIVLQLKLIDSEGVELTDALPASIVRAQPWGDSTLYGLAFEDPITRETSALLYVFMENLQKTTGL